MKFRTDINGLRAYAVLAVIIFHFNKQWLPGGFVGVDVFFVISGYLMTSIIFRGLNTQTFSLLKFYASRIKRIIPALLVLIIILVILGYFFLGPISYRNLSKESIRSLLFISNFLYWRDSGYFDANAFSKPLLHTWSLSVEWQFYILYPIILMICAKFLSLSNLKRLVLIIAALSLAFTIFFSFKNPIASYFLLPTRIWEMLLGGIVFLYPLNLTNKWQKHSLEVFGILLIIVSFWVINEYMPWPGYMALLPTIGAFLLLQANGTSYLTNNIIFQKIGLWSYSLYLYHWPLVYLNYRYNLQMSLWLYLILTFALALCSYYLVELRRWKTKYIIITLIIALVPIYAIYKTKGAAYRVADRYNITADEFAYKYAGGGDFPRYQESFTHPKENNDFDYTILGDSYSRQYAKFLINNNISTRTWFADACLYTTDYTVVFQNKEFQICTDFVKKFYETTRDEPQNKPIIWAQSWDGYTLTKRNGSSELISLKTNKDPTAYVDALKDSIKVMIEANSQKNIYLVGIYTRPDYDIYQCLSEKSLSIFSEVCAEFSPADGLTNGGKAINAALQTMADHYSNVYYIDPNMGFCNAQGCRMLINDEPMFSDDGHLSTFGAEIIGRYIFNEVDAFEQKNQ